MRQACSKPNGEATSRGDGNSDRALQAWFDYAEPLLRTVANPCRKAPSIATRCQEYLSMPRFEVKVRRDPPVQKVESEARPREMLVGVGDF